VKLRPPVAQVAGVLSRPAAGRITLTGVRRQEALAAYLMLAPYLVSFLAFMVIPSAYGLYIGFTDYRLGATRPRWVGVDNFSFVLSDPLFIDSVKNTLVFVLESTPILVILPLLLAVVLNRPVPGRDALRAAFFLPFTLSVSIVSICWWWLLDPNFGPVYFYLGKWNLHPPVWLSNPILAMAAVVLATVWWTAGYNMVLFLAGLQEIPAPLYEAARIDGAGEWRQLWSITLPLLRPTMLFVVIIQIIASFQVFGQVYVMTQGGPGDSTRTVIQHVYETAFVQQRLAEGSAAAWVLFIIILIFSLAQFRFLSGHVEY
jgi:multiple sugar transport system permease protein